MLSKPLVPGTDAMGGVREPDLGIGVPPGWEQSPIFNIPGLVAWTWYIREKKVINSREWRNVLQCPDDNEVQTELSAWWPTVYEDDVQPFLETSREVVEGHSEKYRSLFRARRGDGGWAWLLSQGRVVEKDDLDHLRVSGVITDLSFLRQDAKFLHGCASLRVHDPAPRWGWTLPPARRASSRAALRRCGTASSRYAYIPGIGGGSVRRRRTGSARPRADVCPQGVRGRERAARNGVLHHLLRPFRHG